MLRTLKRDFFAVAVCTLGGAFPGLLHGQTESRPNLIFVLADDLGSESVDGPNDIWDNKMGCETPTLYRMSEIGVSFPNCRVNPNCSPTRAGLMTGRRALSTGVTGVLAHYYRGGINPCASPLIDLYGKWAQATDLTSVQAYERTIAEALQDNDYYTILIDKWHIGGDHVEADGGEDRGTEPDEQGFSAVRSWKDYICDDDPNDDEDTDHMVRMAGMAANLANDVSSQPYALFFHTITPHRRVVDDLGYKWYKVNDSLIPLTETLSTNPSDKNRFIQNVEAINTVIRRDLLFELDVITDDDPESEFDYNENGEPTVVFFLGDNGTDMEVSWYNSSGGPGDPDTDNHAKSSPYEGGIRVPLIVFGEGISGTALEGEVDYRLVSHLDFFDTIADVAGIPDGAGDQKRNTVDDPFKERHGNSFADAIGYEARGID